MDFPEKHSCTSCGEVFPEHDLEFVNGYPFCNICVVKPTKENENNG